MSSRTASWLAWSLAGLSVILCAAAVALYVATLPVQPPISWGTGGTSVVFYVLLPFLPFPLVGAMIASRRPTNPIGWLCLAVGLLWMFNFITGRYMMYGLLVASVGGLPYPVAIGSLAEWLGPTAVMLLGTYLILLFPDGRLPSRRWRPLAWLCGAVIVLNIVVSTFAPGPLSDLRSVSNPFGLEGYPWLAGANEAVGLLFPLCMLVSTLSLVLRFRRSGGVVREQIKWIAFAASLIALGVSVAVVSGTFSEPDAAGGAYPLWQKLSEDAVTLSFASVPVAIGIAVLRHRLYDIDLVINRTLVYGALTVTLALAYAGSVALLQAVFRAPTGQESQLAIVASTLAIAALFQPLRRRIQGFIDRRFYRRKYDAARVLAAFNARLRDEVDLDALGSDLIGVVEDTMQPAHVSLWMRPSPGRGRPTGHGEVRVKDA